MPETLEAAPTVESPDKPVIAPATNTVRSDLNTPKESSGLRAAILASRSGEKNPEKIASAVLEAETPTEPDVIKNESAVVDEPAKADDPLGDPIEKPEAKEEKPAKSSRASLAAESRKAPELEKVKEETKLEGITDAEMKTLPARDQKRIKHFIEISRKAEEGRKQAEDRLAALEAEAKTLRENSGKLPEDINSKLEKLTKFERRFELENDPEIKARFDGKIEAGEKLINETIQKSPLYGDFVAGILKEHGGLTGLSRSRREYGVLGRDGKPEQITGAEIYRRLLDSMLPVEADIIRQTVANQFLTAKEKDQWIAQESEKAKEYFANTAKENQNRFNQWNKRVEETKKAATVVFSEASTKLDWLKDLEVPVDGPADKKNQAIEDKKFRAQLRAALADTMQNPAIINAAAMAQTVDEQTELRDMILDAHRVIDVDRRYAEATKRIAHLEAELAKVRSASSTTKRVGSAPAPAPVVTSSGELSRNEGESDLAYNIRVARAKRSA